LITILAFSFSTPFGCSAGSVFVCVRGGCGTELRDSIADAQPVTSTRDANVFEHLVIELSEQVHLDVVGLKRIGILGEAS
jgi:hypothetical protein